MHTRRIKLRLYTSVEPAGRLERCYPQFVARCTELIAEQRRWAKEAHALLDRRRKWAARASERAHAADVLHDRDAKVGPVRVRPHMPTCLYLTRSTQSRSQSAIVNLLGPHSLGPHSLGHRVQLLTYSVHTVSVTECNC
jgi:hypothetical protein